MLKNIITTYFLVTLTFTLAIGQACDVKQVGFKPGEVVTYRAVYNWGFIWINAGDVEFRVNDTIYQGESALHLKATGWSLKKYDWFFKVRDRFEAIVNPENLKPFWFERDTHEGGYKAYNSYSYDYKAQTIDMITYNSDRPYKKESIPLKPCTFDVMSAVYYCRTLDFDNYTEGDKIPLTMAVDDEIFDLFIRYKGKEQLIARSGEVYNTIRFSVLLVEGTIFKGGEDMEIWVTDDDNRIPVLVDAKILVGSVKAVLTGVEGLKSPMVSKVE